MGRRGEGWRDCRVLSKRRKEGDGENKIRREGNRRERIISCGLLGKAGGSLKKKQWRRGEGSKKEDRRKRQNEGNERERFVKDYVLFIERASFLFFFFFSPPSFCAGFDWQSSGSLRDGVIILD